MKNLFLVFIIFQLGVTALFSFSSDVNETYNRNKEQSIDDMENKTKKIIDHHFSSFRDNDLKEVLSDYSEESIIFTPNNVYKGLSSIRELFINAFLSYSKEGTLINIDTLIINDNMAYVVWRGETSEFEVPFSTATYIIKDNIIYRHTIGRVTIPKTKSNK